MTSWPVSLPGSPLLDGFSETAPETVIRTEMDQGPAKLRQRTTAGVRRLRMAFLLTTAQVETIDEFYTDTLKGGALPFVFAHPRSEEALNLRFTAPPVYSPAGNGYFRVGIEAEAMP